MSYGSISNPYAQPSRPTSQLSAEDSLKRLFLLQSPPSATVILPIIDQYSSQRTASISWDSTLVEGLTRLALQRLDDLVESVTTTDDAPIPVPAVSEGSLATLYLLTLAMEDWSDECMYIALIQSIGDSESRINLLGSCMQLATAGTDTIHRLAFLALTAAYRSMDRLDRYLTLDVSRPDLAWWLDGTTTKDKPVNLSSTAVDLLLSPQMAPSKMSASQNRYQPCTDQLQLAASSYLCTVLKRDLLCGNVFRNDQEIDAVYRHSLLHMQMTSISTAVPTSYSSGALHLTLMFASLLNLIQWRHDVKMTEYDTMVPSTFFVENVITLLFPSPGNSPSSSFHALDLLDCWALSGGIAWVVFQKHEKQWRSAIVDFWTCARASQMDPMIPQLPVMVLLHSRSRLPSRVALSLIFQNNTTTGDPIPLEDTGKDIVTALLRLLRSSEQSTILYAASLLRVLLSDRCALSTHDDISRALWGSIGVECLEQILHCVILHVSDPQEVFRPSTLVLLDLLDTLLQEQNNCDLVLKIISIEHLERIIALLKSKKEKYAGQDDLSHGQNSNTPPANHLSRIEDTSTISVEEEDDRVSVGLDSTLHLACATILARLGNCDSPLAEEGLHLLKARACNVVTDFVEGFYSRAPRTKGLLSFDHSKRSLRLQLAVGTSENEDLLSTALFSAQLLQKNLYLEMQDDAHTAQSKLKAAEDRARDLEVQVKKLSAENRSQAIISRRELSRVKENAYHEAKQLVGIHATERSSAENRFIACRRELEKAEFELRNALVQAEESKRVLSIANDELQHSLAKTLEIEKDNKELSRQIEQEVTQAAALKEEMRCQEEKFDSLFRTTQQLERELQESGKAIEEFRATNETLRDNLEELFADMVDLATVYESKESELASIHRKHHDELEGVHRNLRREKERGKEIQKARDELQETNERQQRKLEKYKQRLEEERRDREEDNIRRKRNGPVSYINQLHQSSSLDRSRDPSMTKESGSSHSMSRSRLEKENAYTYSSSSLHRNKML